MNKAAIKKFAVESRQKLIKSVIERLEELGITDKEVLELVEEKGIYTLKSLTLNELEKKNRQIILSKIEEKGYEPFIEEVAYTWFNRMIAIRYMEVNDYLPFRTRVLSSEVQGKVDPDIITEIADHIEELELNRDKVIELKEQNKQEELFKYIFIKVCNYLGRFLPQMFEQIEDYTELLLPSVMISNGSVIKDMIELVPEEDWTNQVEIIGWLYQYYISEKKDQVFADLKKNKKITKENIPAATQLFTPEWIVKYMVENSLGRLWLEGHPNEELQSSWKYYLEEAKQEPDVEKELEKIREESKNLSPEDITVLDPSMGSGHILVYAFDVLYQIYQSVGYSEKEIPRLILEKNIHGLDIDDRAGQLAYFALMMKARSKSRRFLKDIHQNPIMLNLCSLQESNDINLDNFISYLIQNKEFYEEITKLIESFKDVKTLGSILQITTPIDKHRIDEILDDLNQKIVGSIDFSRYQVFKNKINVLINQAQIMNKKFDVIITNPPYMGSKGMDLYLSNYVREHYKKSKSDLYAIFMERAIKWAKKNSFISMITMESWMFLASFEDIRKEFILNKNIISLINMPYEGKGRTSLGINFGTSAFVIRNNNFTDYNGKYMCIHYNEIDEDGVPFEFPVINTRFSSFKTNQVINIPGSPLIYWFSLNTIKLFKDEVSISKIINPRIGLITGDNNRFLRFWYEVNISKIGIGIKSISESIESRYKWFPYHKGGDYRKWYGNLEYIVNWENDGFEMKYNNSLNGRVRSHNYNGDYSFQKGITWSSLTSGKFSCRFSETGFMFDAAGPICHVLEQSNINEVLGYLSSTVATYFLDALNPTINMHPGYLSSLPYVELSSQNKYEVNSLVDENLKISMNDWNLFEKSWNFLKHPLINFKNQTLEKSFELWSEFAINQFIKLKNNEGMLNSIFIKNYSLEKDLNPIVNDDDITIRKADRDRDIKSFISYAVGCMMGRYSLDEEGLIFAGGEFDESKYQTFNADEDGILLISDTEYFEDDLLNRFVEFVKVVYGEETLEENLDFIADTECFKRKSTESARDCLRRYFLKGFMEDHLKVYQKRPIYWMFDSGKQNGFKALIYMHRYNEDMVAKVRTDYLHPLQRKYEAELERLDHLINFDNISAAEKGKAKKRQEQIHKQLDECTQYDLLLAHVAHQRIPLDLDDGVKVNYQKFQNIELTTDGSSKAKKGDLLYKVKM